MKLAKAIGLLILAAITATTAYPKEGPDMGKSALILVDIQNDFLPGGALPVPHGDEIIQIANDLRELKGEVFDYVLATRDWHPKGHISFASTHNGQPYVGKYKHHNCSEEQTMWPDHCIQETPGSKFPANLIQGFDAIFDKGSNSNIEAYSAFFDQSGGIATDLHQWLLKNKVSTIYTMGLAGNVCVMRTALDAQKLGLKTYVISDGARSVDLTGGPNHCDAHCTAMGTMSQVGIKIISSADLMSKRSS